MFQWKEDCILKSKTTIYLSTFLSSENETKLRKWDWERRETFVWHSWIETGIKDRLTFDLKGRQLIFITLGPSHLFECDGFVLILFKL